MNEELLIRNFDIMKRVFDNLDVLTTYYKLSQRDINVVHMLLTKHTTYNAFIEVKTTEFVHNRRVVYRALDKLENENIITVVERPRNQYNTLKVYFTISFIKRMCDEEFATNYEKWLEWQKSYKEEVQYDGSNS